MDLLVGLVRSGLSRLRNSFMKTMQPFAVIRGFSGALEVCPLPCIHCCMHESKSRVGTMAAGALYSQSCKGRNNQSIAAAWDSRQIMPIDLALRRKFLSLLLIYIISQTCFVHGGLGSASMIRAQNSVSRAHLHLEITPPSYLPTHHYSYERITPIAVSLEPRIRCPHSLAFVPHAWNCKMSRNNLECD